MILSLPSSSDYEAWIRQFNLISAHKCAMSHLTSAIGMMVDVSLYSADSMKSFQSDLLSSSEYSHPLLHSGGAQVLLESILGKLDIASSGSGHEGMDRVLLPSATRNLSNAVLNLCEFMASLQSEGVKSPGDLVQLGALVSRAVYSSSIGEDTADEASIRYERTSTLGCSLVQLLRSSASVELSFVKQQWDDFVRAAQGLAKLCCFKVDPSGSDPNAIVSVLCRSYLTSLVLAVCDESASTVDQSFVCSFMPLFISQYLELVARLDEDICNFLQVVAAKPFGTQLLVSSRIDRCLNSAAMNYVHEESSVIANLRNTVSSSNQAVLRSPGFLLGHLKLMCALLSSAPAQLPQETSKEFALGCVQILATYQRVFDSLCHNFPEQADILRLFLRVFVLASSLSQPANNTGHGNISNGWSHRFKSVFLAAGFLQNGIIRLVRQISENPLPSSMLPSNFPVELRKSPTVESNTVHVEKDSGKTWWENLDEILKSKKHQSRYVFDVPMGENFFMATPLNKWNEDMFEYSIVSADILFMGLNLIKRLDQLNLIDSLSVARGLLCTSYAAKTVHMRLEEVSARLNTSFTVSFLDADENGSLQLEADYVNILSSQLGMCTRELLVLGLLLCDPREDHKENGSGAIQHQLVVAIEGSGLASSATALNVPKEDQEFISCVCKAIENADK
mmetsp:Transcript_19153/g.34498  ORF Transcript_19153/g.34498 Transcript_19153/m.34498 type:complete len:678 (-) Transcript_19153:46-2079(-)